MEQRFRVTIAGTEYLAVKAALADFAQRLGDQVHGFVDQGFDVSERMGLILAEFEGQDSVQGVRFVEETVPLLQARHQSVFVAMFMDGSSPEDLEINELHHLTQTPAWVCVFHDRSLLRQLMTGIHADGDAARSGSVEDVLASEHASEEWWEQRES